jgi:hypothetical protein
VSDWAMKKAREVYWRDCETTEKTIHSIATALREAEARGEARGRALRESALVKAEPTIVFNNDGTATYQSGEVFKLQGVNVDKDQGSGAYLASDYSPSAIQVSKNQP